MVIIKQKQPHLPISISITSTYKHAGCMITIGKIPRKLQSFFKPLRGHFTQRAGQHLGLSDYRGLRYRAVVDTCTW